MSELIDNRARRVAALKRVILGLHAGDSLDSVRARMAELVRECDASEVASMEQELIADGMPIPQVMKMCDLHSQAVRGTLVERSAPEIVAGHPLDTFRRENSALSDQIQRVRDSLTALEAAAEGEAAGARLEEARRAYGLLMDVDKHYQRKEHLLFPFLEARGITGPSSVMWGKDDEVRARLADLGEALSVPVASAAEWGLVAKAVAEPAFVALEEMIFKEERILFPLALQSLTEGEWGEIAAQSPQFGYCLVDPAGDWRHSARAPRTEPDSGAASARADAAHPEVPIVFPSGALSLTQLTAIFQTLPVDLTFVDAHDRVRFFSEGRSRVFHRAKAVIGRRVQHCHPPASVGVVDRILADFRSGAQGVAEFWIEMRGRFVQIRYFALRDEAGGYLGTLEVTQDLTHERALSGERRLLEYEGQA